MKQTLQELKSHRSLEHDELEDLSKSFSQYEGVRKDLENKLHSSYKHTLQLQQEIIARDEKIHRLEKELKEISQNKVSSTGLMDDCFRT